MDKFVQKHLFHMEELSDIEKKVYVMYIKKRIIERCKKMSLPLFVQSTAVIFWSRFPKYNINAAITLACKSNDRDINMKVCDMELAREMDYNFHQPSPYLRMYGLIVILQERSIIECGDDYDFHDKETSLDSNLPDDVPVKIDINALWNRSVENMEKILLLDKEIGVNEMAVSALYLPLCLFQNILEIDWELVDEVKKEISEMIPLDKRILNDILLKIDIESITR